MVLLFLMRMSPARTHSLLTFARCWLNAVSVCRQMIRMDFWQSLTVSLSFPTVTVTPHQRHERETQSSMCEAEEEMHNNSVTIRGKE